MLKKIIQKFISIVQKILIMLILIVIYFVGFGITLIFIFLFNRKLLTGGYRIDNTFWIEAQGYEADINNCRRQS
jgi:hypothetical protein